LSLAAAALRPSPAQRWIACVVLLAGAFLPPADFFIVNVSLSSIHATLHASAAQVELVISGYAAGYAVFLVTGGRLGDLYGRRRMFLWGMAGFTLTNALCGLAPSAAVLVAARAVQGISASLLLPQVLGAMPTLFDDERGLARAMSAYGVMMGLAAAAGQFGGGALVAWSPWELGWRGVFLLKLPVCLAVLLIAWFAVPETSTARRARLDLVGIVLLSAALAALILPLVEGRQSHWPAWTIGSLLAAPLLLALFIAWEARLTRLNGSPLFDLTLVRIGSFRRGAVVSALFFFTTPFYLLFGLYQQEGRGIDPLFVGLAFLPYGIGLFAGSMATAPLPARIRPRLLTIGMMIQVAGYAAIGFGVAYGLRPDLLMLTVFIAGFGQGIALPRLYNVALGHVPPDKAGVATGVINSIMQIGSSVSVAAIGSLFFAVLGTGHGEAAYAHAFGVAMIAIVSALGAAMLATMLPD
jgi:EmrB/QacA subfamily drug resistance transporter